MRRPMPTGKLRVNCRAEKGRESSTCGYSQQYLRLTAIKPQFFWKGRRWPPQVAVAGQRATAAGFLPGLPSQQYLRDGRLRDGGAAVRVIAECHAAPHSTLAPGGVKKSHAKRLR